MSKGSKSKRNIIKGKNAVQPSSGEDRITVSKVSRELEERKD
ncbi:hypothetical protein PU629_08730 [Pullulanibacillus sp. KACC 23026]|nr:hypothetical protein [Pullulanibacillus sp. KACC 23026]WEG14423.1 hypothetical protein PU629_08730 [Pullulanibacillus sp. KACC 23026]